MKPLIIRAGRVASLVFAIAVQATASAADQSLQHDETPSIPKAQAAVEEYVNSGRYEQSISSVLSQARSYILERAQVASSTAKLALVLDIDETSLSNVRAFRLNGWAQINSLECNLVQGPCGLYGFITLGQSAAIPATVSLAQLSTRLGIMVVFITARPEIFREQTTRNLRNAGFQEFTLYMRRGPVESIANYKTSVRKMLTEAGLTIVANIGDQWSDLEGGFAEKTYKLPNPFYESK